MVAPRAGDRPEGTHNGRTLRRVCGSNEASSTASGAGLQQSSGVIACTGKPLDLPCLADAFAWKMNFRCETPLTLGVAAISVELAGKNKRNVLPSGHLAS